MHSNFFKKKSRTGPDPLLFHVCSTLEQQGNPCPSFWDPYWGFEPNFLTKYEEEEKNATLINALFVFSNKNIACHVSFKGMPY